MILEKSNKEKACQFEVDRQTLMEKSGNDDQYIEVLKRELEKARQSSSKNQ